MFEEELNDMDVMGQSIWYDVDGIVDMDGELRSTLANLHERKERHKKVVEKISYLISLLDKGKEVIDDSEKKLDEKNKKFSRLKEEVIRFKKELKAVKDQIDNGLKIRGGSEVLDAMLSSQKQSKYKGGLDFENGECSKTSRKKDKGKENIKDDLKNSNKDKKIFYFRVGHLELPKIEELLELPKLEELLETPSFSFQVFLIF